ncbi:hypothetical protein HDU86_004333 [Geranomyces michiganensis]|nr:hypothetical protein HDU86_004333 [Geranomyces michiganensis]
MIVLKQLAILTGLIAASFLTPSSAAVVKLGAWNRLDGLLSQMSVNANSVIVGVNSAGQIWRRVAGQWVQSTDTNLKTAARANWISLCDNGSMWHIGTGNTIWYSPKTEPTTWAQSSGLLVQVHCGVTHVWGVNAANEIYRRPRTAKLTDDWEKIGGFMKQIDTFGSSVWGINPSGTLFVYTPDAVNANGDHWATIDGTASYVASGLHYAFIVRNGGLLYRDTDQNAWVPVPSPPGITIGAAAVGGGVVYVMSKPDNFIYSATLATLKPISSSAAGSTQPAAIPANANGPSSAQSAAAPTNGAVFDAGAVPDVPVSDTSAPTDPGSSAAAGAPVNADSSASSSGTAGTTGSAGSAGSANADKPFSSGAFGLSPTATILGLLAAYGLFVCVRMW